MLEVPLVRTQRCVSFAARDRAAMMPQVRRFFWVLTWDCEDVWQTRV